MAVLELKGVSKGYGHGAARAEVLQNIDLSVEEGEFLAILGFSGTGKTTLINLLAGLETPDRGRALFRGSEIVGPDPERGVVFQSYSLMPWLTVEGNVAMAVDAVHGSKRRQERDDLVRHYVEMVGLSHALDRRPAELSGGMRQRVAVARALAMQPDVLLLDEPLSALDALTRANLQDEIERIWEADRRTVVLITNDVDEAILLADRILALNPDGSLGVEFDNPLARPRDRTAMNHNPAFKHLRAKVTQYLMDVGIAAKAEETRSLPEVTPIHAAPKAYAEAARSTTDERYLQFSQLSKIYPTPKGPLTVVEEFDLTLHKGEFVSLIGHSGCGKSTVLTMTAGL
ncbi:MAG: ATP-binding cassette domain-containing protein, partial [Pseudomonadota bacterium]